MINSKKKGSRGELLFVKLCKKYGYNVRRTQQYCGNTGDAADVTNLSGIHVEVKCVQALNLAKAMEQAVNDCKDDKIPIVAHKKDYKPWYITMSAENWFKLYGEWITHNETR